MLRRHARPLAWATTGRCSLHLAYVCSIDVEQGYLVIQGRDRRGGVRVEVSPATDMLFRPEEVHLPSTLPGIWYSGVRKVPVPHYGGGVGCEDLPIPHLNADAFVAV